MKYVRAIALSLMAVLFAGLSYAQFTPTYGLKTTSVTSATTPVAVILAGTGVNTWYVRPRAAAAVPVLCWPFSGATPAATPSPAAVMEVSAGSPWVDNFTPPVAPPTQVGIACVLESGVTAVTVDAAWR